MSFVSEPSTRISFLYSSLLGRRSSDRRRDKQNRSAPSRRPVGEAFLNAVRTDVGGSGRRCDVRPDLRASRHERRPADGSGFDAS